MILIFLKRHCKTNEEHCDQSAAELPFLSFETHVITSRRNHPRGHPPGGRVIHYFELFFFLHFTLRELTIRGRAE